MTYIIRYLFFFILIALSPSVFAQLTIQGTVIDKELNEGLPFAHVGVKESTNVVVSDIDGIFSITIPAEQMGEVLMISMIGYDNFEMPIEEIQSKNVKEFSMKTSTAMLAEAVVRSPEKILSDAIDKIEENFWSEKFMTEGFYRKAAVEDSKFAYVTEALVRVENDGYHKTDKESLSIEITQLRSSNDFRSIEVLEHNNPLFTSFYTRDIIKNREIKDLLASTKTKLAIMETSTYNNEDIYIITVDPHVIYIGFENDEIYRIDFWKSNNADNLGTSYQYRKYKGKLYQFYHRRRWMPKINGKHIGNVLVGKYGDRDIRVEAKSSVAEHSEKGKNEELSKYYERQFWTVRNAQSEISQKVLNESPTDNIGMVHEFIANKIVLKSEEKYKMKQNINLREDIFRTQVYYDGPFWNSYKTATESKYLQMIRADLETSADGKPLEDQYSETGMKNNNGNRKFKKRMEKEGS